MGVSCCSGYFALFGFGGGGGLRATTRKTPVGSPEKNTAISPQSPGKCKGPTIAADIRPVSLYMALGIVHGQKSTFVCV